MEVPEEEKKPDQNMESSSETSSYHSLGNEVNIDGKKFELESASDEGDLDMEDGPVLTSYLKTKNELDPTEIEKVGPEKVVLDDIDEIIGFGKVV